jgi:hypothetical protein
MSLDDPKFEFLKESIEENKFNLRNELSFDLAAVNRLRDSQDPSKAQSFGPVHDLQWLESKLQVDFVFG